MNNGKSIAGNIRKARLYRNYSQEYLACKLDISQNAYSKIELGYTKITVERINAIAQILNVSALHLMDMDEYARDVSLISQIKMVPTLLEVICKVTGMGFAAIARVSEQKWIACAVLDHIAFGLQPGGELKIETTLCNDVRDSRKLIVIDHVAEDATYCKHLTPSMYGFQSYISIPIIRQDGTFFGTLCAIDPQPHKLNDTTTIAMFNLFADLISFHIQALAPFPLANGIPTTARQRMTHLKLV